MSSSARAAAPPSLLERARQALAGWHLDSAEALLKRRPPRSSAGARAVLLARLDLQRSRFAAVRERLAPLIAAAPDAWEARVVLGRALLSTGQRERARAVLDPLADAYNADRLESGEALEWLGVAMQLSGWYESANRAFGEALARSPGRDSARLRWAELFIEKHNLADSDQLYREVLERRPGDLSALTGRARVDILSDHALGKARARLERVLAAAPQHVPAHNLRALIELQSERPEAAAAYLRAHSLTIAPSDPEALALLGAAYHLADDDDALRTTERRALSVNPHFAAFYTTVAEHSARAHRYREAIEFNDKALALDPKCWDALAGLGMGHSRLGEDDEALASLERAFAGDPYNVRTYNLLAHFYDDVERHYEWLDLPPMRLRVHKRERAILERYLPALLSEAYGRLSARYRFTPSPPLHVEIFADAQSFAVRSTGLPTLSAHGVCFGHVITSRSPSEGDFNWAEVLWHELSHVFHIQLSHSRVPRWFSEGLAVYESTQGRPAWIRERDEALLAYRRRGALRGIGDFDLSFTQAETMGDMLVAYYHAYEVARFIVREWGRQSTRKMLTLWGAHKSTAEVFKEALGVTLPGFDARFSKWLDAELSYLERGLHLERDRVSGPPRRYYAAARRAPAELATQLDAATAALVDRDWGRAQRFTRRALALDGRAPHARLIRAALRSHARDYRGARADLQALLDAGHDGYELRVSLARALHHLGDDAAAAAQLKAALALRPRDLPLHYTLIERLDAAGMEAEAWRWRRRAAELDQDNPTLIKALLEGASAQELSPSEIRHLVEQGNHIAPFDAPLHRAAARALAAAGADKQARYEARSALIAAPHDPNSEALLKSLRAP